MQLPEFLAEAIEKQSSYSCETRANLLKLYNRVEALSLPSSRNPAISGFMAGGESRYFHGQFDVLAWSHSALHSTRFAEFDPQAGIGFAFFDDSVVRFDQPL